MLAYHKYGVFFVIFHTIPISVLIVNYMYTKTFFHKWKYHRRHELCIWPHIAFDSNLLSHIRHHITFDSTSKLHIRHHITFDSNSKLHFRHHITFDTSYESHVRPHNTFDTNCNLNNNFGTISNSTPILNIWHHTDFDTNCAFFMPFTS